MSEQPLWLPDMLVLDGEWGDTLAALYALFTRDFKETRLVLDGCRVIYDKTVRPGDLYEDGFWHLISRDSSCGRLPDYRRAERLPWCAPSIRNYLDSSAVRYWTSMERNGRYRTYLWLEKLDYVVVLERKTKRLPHIMFLVTAFHVDGASSRNRLYRKYNGSVK